MDKIMDKREARAQKRIHLALPKYSLAEEITNAVTHGLGVALAIAGLVVLLIYSPKTPLAIISVCLFGASMFLLYMVSTLYHSLGVNRAKKVFQVLDHCTIFFLIAGTYTPISLLCIGGTVGWVLVSIVWGVGILGTVLTAVDMHRFKVFSMVCYIALGWCVIIFIKPLIDSMDQTSIVLLVVGGVLYTVGAVIYGLGRKVPYMHSVWHLFCLAGTVFHYFVVLRICMFSA
ncbi:hemolysin III family protein [Hydrogeniiclostridium mannosilyticum]|uniref:Hemolysin III family protein n=1 Tax=Hydrogeniiclostridium mannosilyticum TaxID=2764322 RepID=A0A328U8D9_9FIRM|nr:hemolysin III family protein [Hydrogeniiclostridium mannosilyticum]RAQ22173.1 hemolysin III family protein [Hydrogeniiclostridium mannosilyticum]